MNDKTMVRVAAKELPASGASSPTALADKRTIEMLDPDVLGCLTVELVAQLGRGAMPIRELANLDPGQVLVLDTPLNGSVDLTLNDRLVGRGEIVAVEGLFGVRITEIFVFKP